jgi:hypothetical protein
MPRYKLRTLLILLAVLPPLIGITIDKALGIREAARRMKCSNGCTGQVINGRFVPSRQGIP